MQGLKRLRGQGAREQWQYEQIKHEAQEEGRYANRIDAEHAKVERAAIKHHKQKELSEGQVLKSERRWIGGGN
jgi:hypothetical protein